MVVKAEYCKAYVLAGRRPQKAGQRSDRLDGFEGVSHKALIKVGSNPIIVRVFKAVKTTGFGPRPTLVGEGEVLEVLKDHRADHQGKLDFDTLVPKPTLSDTAQAILDDFEQKYQSDPKTHAGGVLITTSDHALLTSEMIQSFLKAIPANVDAAVGMVEQQVYRSTFPDGPRTFLRLRDGAFSGANLFWLSGKAARPLVGFWKQLEAKRKNPLAMAAVIGPEAVLAYAMGKLSRDKISQILKRKTGVAAAIVTLPIAEAAIDVDKPEDVSLVRALVDGRDDI